MRNDREPLRQELILAQEPTPRMTIGELQKLLADADPLGHVIFNLGDCSTELRARESYTTTTKDAAFIEFDVPADWEKK